jgi:hypothetical protein
MEMTKAIERWENEGGRTEDLSMLLTRDTPLIPVAQRESSPSESSDVQVDGWTSRSPGRLRRPNAIPGSSHP